MTDVTISLGENGGFVLTVPSDVNGAHNVLVPPTASGFAIMRKVLSARQRESDRRLGHDSSPTQAQVDAWLNEDRRRRAEEAKKPEKPINTGILAGLDLGDIDL